MYYFYAFFGTKVDDFTVLEFHRSDNLDAWLGSLSSVKIAHCETLSTQEKILQTNT
jgi:hypothetical protein